MMWEGVAVLAFVTVQRLAELMLSQRNTRRLLARGANEVAPGHYPFLVTLHAAWLAVLWVFGPGPPIEVVPLVLFALLQLGRVWVIATLGERWTTRIVCLPGVAPVTGGPYRWLRHPNYLAVILEIASLPLVHTAWLTALVFSLLDGILLRVRIRAEEEGLSRLSGYDEAFAGRPRLFPGG